LYKYGISRVRVHGNGVFGSQHIRRLEECFFSLVELNDCACLYLIIIMHRSFPPQDHPRFREHSLPAPALSFMTDSHRLNAHFPSRDLGRLHRHNPARNLPSHREKAFRTHRSHRPRSSTGLERDGRTWLRHHNAVPYRTRPCFHSIVVVLDHNLKANHSPVDGAVHTPALN
jgi:hypothetical protein